MVVVKVVVVCCPCSRVHPGTACVDLAQERFKKAITEKGEAINKLDNAGKLKFYALFKQATEGDNTSGR